MPFGVGETSVRRRRGVTNLFNPFAIYLSFALFFFSISNLSFPKNPSKTLQELFCSKGYFTDGRVNRYSTSSDLNQILYAYPLVNPTSDVSKQSSRFTSHTSEQGLITTSFGSRSGLAPAPPLSPSHRTSLMARASLGSSDVLSPVGTPTAHDELISWRMVQQGASSPHATPILQNGSESCSLLPTVPTLGFTRMGLDYPCGPLTPLWPISRSELSTALLSFSQIRIYLIMERNVSHSVIGTLFLGKTSLINPQNHMDIALYLSPDISLRLQLCGVLFIICYDAYQATAPFPDLEPSMNPPRSEVDKFISSSPSLAPITSVSSSRGLLGNRTLAYLEWFDRFRRRGIFFSSVRMFAMCSYTYEPQLTELLNPLLIPFEPNPHLSPLDLKLGFVVNSQGQTDYKLCVDFLNLHGVKLHVREDPPTLLQFDTHYLQNPIVASSSNMRSVCKSLKDYVSMLMNPLLLARSPPTVSHGEHLSTSSNALYARAIYDQSLVEDLVKPVFKDESTLVPIDFSNIVKLIQVENSFDKLMELLPYVALFMLNLAVRTHLLLKIQLN